MKKIIYLILSISMLLACKKESVNSKISNTEATISSFECSSLYINGRLKKNEKATGVYVILYYNGGNGQNYESKTYASTGVIGLTATLKDGTLANGKGFFQIIISGTPFTSGTASFNIDFSGITCSYEMNVEEIAKAGPSLTDVDGNNYNTVYIGTQHWMAENLKTSKYSDGTIIPNVTAKDQWKILFTNSSGAWCNYNNNDSLGKIYGKLYNWYTVSPTTNNNKNVCPTGWHVPTRYEWDGLINYLGGLTEAGSRMKEVGTINWNSPNTDATNTSLFSGLPGGLRSSDYSDFLLIGNAGRWWSSSEASMGSGRSWSYGLNSSSGNVLGSESGTQTYGLSIRCIKD